MDWVIKFTGSPEEKTKINFHVAGNSGSYINYRNSNMHGNIVFAFDTRKHDSCNLIT